MNIDMKDNTTKGAAYGAVVGLIIMALWSLQMSAKVLPDIITTMLYGLVMIPAYIMDAIGVGDYWALSAAIIIIWAIFGALVGYVYDME